MYCNNCGSEVTAGITMCPKCGRMVPGAWTGHPGRSLASHLSLLVIFWYVIGALRLIPVIIMVLLAGAAGAALRGQERMAQIFGPAVFVVIAVLIGIFALLAFLTAWGLQTRQPWGRTMALVVGVINLLSIPFGTALGIYTLVVLLPEEADREFQQMAAGA